MVLQVLLPLENPYIEVFQERTLIMLNTDLIVEVISQFTIHNGRPPSFDDIHQAAVGQLNVALGDDAIMEAIEKLLASGMVAKDCDGGFIVK